jgi:uncharacterized oligopeptide transporter (OPT) family protein
MNQLNSNNVKITSAFKPSIFIFNIIISVLGAIIGLELITRTGVTPNTSIIGALLAILIARIPFKLFNTFKNINTQNLVQTATSGATFSAANALFVPISIPFLMQMPELIYPMLLGASLGVITDASMLYFSFDTPVFPAKSSWPPGVAAAESIMAAAKHGKKAILLVYGIAGGLIGKSGLLGIAIPTDMIGIAFIGSIASLFALGIGLIFRGYSIPLLGFDINKVFMPPGIMIGAGLVALIQIIKMLLKKNKDIICTETKTSTKTLVQLRRILLRGYGVFLLIALIIALVSGIYCKMSPLMFFIWIVFAAFAAITSELIVGISAMHSGWFPAFATTLIFLVLGIIIGFPTVPMVILVGFTASTGPAFADMAFDLKAGWILRGKTGNLQDELYGRKQQYFAGLLSFFVSIIVVLCVYNFYFDKGLIPPAAKAFATTIKAGNDPNITKHLIMWAIPGAIIQLIGGSKQIGVLFATGLLIYSPIAGIVLIAGLLARIFIVKIYGEQGQKTLYSLGAGFIAGAALYSFFNSTLNFGRTKH